MSQSTLTLNEILLNEISELADIYLKRIAKDHHKTKDGYFYIECEWAGYDSYATVPRFRAIHNGYINEIRKPVNRNTFHEAAEDLRDFLVECIAEYKDEDWGWDENEPEVNRTLDTSSTHLP